MFRTPIYAVSVRENEKEGGNGLYHLIHRCVNYTLGEELRKYFIDPAIYDMIYGEIDTPVTDDEIQFVDWEKLGTVIPGGSLASVLPVQAAIPFLPTPKGLSDHIAYPIPDLTYLGRKLVQLVKILKADEDITPDLIQEMMISCIGENADPVERSTFPEIRELKTAILAGCREIYGEETAETYLESCENLYCMVTQDLQNETEWLFWDADYEYLYDDPTMEGRHPLETLLYGSPDYEEPYISKMYTSVGVEVPDTVQNILDSVKKALEMVPREKAVELWQERLEKTIEAAGLISGNDREKPQQDGADN